MQNTTSTVTTTTHTNPLLAPWNTPHGLPPFEAVQASDFVPAFAQALEQHRTELSQIAHNAAAPSFDNTLAAFDQSGALLKRVEKLFTNLCASQTSEGLQAAERDMAAPLAAHKNAMYTDAALFARVDALYQQRSSLGLDAQQLRLLERVHLDFVRAGSQLSTSSKQRYGELVEQLATLQTRFSQNVLADEAAFELLLRSEDELAGLPPFVRAAAQQAAQERGHGAGVYLVTLSRSHITPFLTFSARRDLREKAFKAWLLRGEMQHGDALRDNKLVAAQILQLRLEQAQLHGYSNYAEYALADTMAAKPQAVLDLLETVWQRASARARLEAQELQSMATTLGDAITLQPWDWFYYAEKLRKAQFDLDEAALKPYFSLERVTQAAFDCAQRLFGITFKERADIASYHPDVKTYEVYSADGKLVAIFLHDNYARASKQGGAWMDAYREQSHSADGTAVIPIIVNNNNFAKGSAGEPTLLSFDDARTLFHEFGHGLHGMLSQVRYERLSGTNVLSDFVELPSQLFEHWFLEPEVLAKHARHYQTGEVIPQQLLASLQAARDFNRGFEAATYCASALVDMQLHLLQDLHGLDLNTFEAEQLERIHMPTQLYMRHRLPHFMHLFSGSSYAARYYVYLWAEVLDADAYDAFTEAGNPFDQATAQRLLRYIYSSGGSLDPMQAYSAFRGRAPTLEPMLRKKGLVQA